MLRLTFNRGYPRRDLDDNTSGGWLPRREKAPL
jgi:hypothetical protein